MMLWRVFVVGAQRPVQFSGRPHSRDRIGAMIFVLRLKGPDADADVEAVERLLGVERRTRA